MVNNQQLVKLLGSFLELPLSSKLVGEIAVITFGTLEFSRVKQPSSLGTPFFQSCSALFSSKSSRMTHQPTSWCICKKEQCFKSSHNWMVLNQKLNVNTYSKIQTYLMLTSTLHLHSNSSMLQLFLVLMHHLWNVGKRCQSHYVVCLQFSIS